MLMKMESILVVGKMISKGDFESGLYFCWEIIRLSVSAGAGEQHPSSVSQTTTLKPPSTSLQSRPPYINPLKYFCVFYAHAIPQTETNAVVFECLHTFSLFMRHLFYLQYAIFQDFFFCCHFLFHCCTSDKTMK